jgi:UDP-N-acetylmuramoyl-L-alanyl-D-glutamate--2,6-diaminopimelate ligase
MQELVYHLKRIYHLFKTGLFKGLPARIKTAFPDRHLKIIAITGTDGKTTSSTLLYHLMHQAGYKVALISTVAAYINGEEIETGFHVTSPSPDLLYRLLRRMVKEKVEYLVLEFTSQGAYQYRLFGIHPILAGVTNIAQDHFDYHLNYQNYLEAKAIVLRQSRSVVLNSDDASYYRLKRLLPSSFYHVLEYSEQESLPGQLQNAIRSRFPEHFNQMNARLVCKLAQEIGLNNQAIADGIASFPGVPGRMQFIESKQKFSVVVDFAHTPQGLENALSSLRNIMKKQHLHGRLIAVYGCAGLRDAIKRPIMGEIGCRLADLVIFTAEDPRSENVWSIIRQMKENLQSNHNKVLSIADRQEAIQFALKNLAKEGDLIGIFGKGPEKTMAYGQTETPWSDLEAVKKALS